MDLKAFLSGPFSRSEDEDVDWRGLPLRVTGVECDSLPPLDAVTSVRCILIQSDSVFVFQTAEGPHLLPGGRREPGEALTETLTREIREETGWTPADPSLIGCLHFHHLGPKPPGYRYPYPNFLQLVYAAEAADPRPEADRSPDFEKESGFVPLGEISSVGLPVAHRFLLDAALRRRVAGPRV